MLIWISIEEIGGDDLLTFVYTSGTGRPQGVMLSHKMCQSLRSRVESDRCGTR